jgi:predicted ArsR family transcriptional regulator
VKTSRQEVLDYVISQRAVSAHDLNRAMQMTEANARHHLHILMDEGLVSSIGFRPVQGKGRPVQLFGPSERITGHNLGRLAIILFEELMDGMSDPEAAQLVQRLAARLLGEAGQPALELPPGHTHLAQRLYQAVRQLNHFNYSARWEAHAIAPRLILGQCPYVGIVAERPEICRLDQALIERLVGVSAEQIARLQPDRRGVPQCIFTVYDK